MQPAGKYLGEEYYRAGGLPAVMNELRKAGKLHEDALTVNGKTMGENVRRARIEDEDVIRTYEKPMLEQAGFKVLSGNLFDSAIMKLVVISEEFRNRYLINPKDPNAFEGRAVVFDGPEDYHHRIDDPSLKIDENTMLFVRGTGPIGYPGAAEVVNMQPPAALIKTGHHVAALHRRRAAVRHLGLAVDPQRVARGGGGRRARAAQDRRPRAHRPQQGHRQHPDLEGASSPSGRPRCRSAAATRSRRARRRGRRSSAHGRPALRRHGAEAGGEVPEGRAAEWRAEG